MTELTVFDIIAAIVMGNFFSLMMLWGFWQLRSEERFENHEGLWPYLTIAFPLLFSVLALSKYFT